MVDIARLFSARGVKSTIIATPANGFHFSDAIGRDRQSGLDISIQTIPFPSLEVGLPEGIENLNALVSPDMVMKFLKGVDMLQQPFEMLLQELRPDCIVADMFLTWTTDIAKKYQIPRLVFHGQSYFAFCLGEGIKGYASQLSVMSDSDSFVVPGLPDRIVMNKSQLAHHTPKLRELLNKIRETEVTSYGVLVNSFHQLEPAYEEYFKKYLGRRAWDIGPVSLYNRSIVDKTQRGKKASIDGSYCLKWLDTKEKNSVLYVSFGTIARFGVAQIHEIARGLEASGVSFIWTVRIPADDVKNEILPEGFEERMEGKGLIIREWAPQVLILDHPAVGGFMTHCGWNSTLEGICAGLPLITWPMFAEQFNNEKFVIDLLKIGVPSGNEAWKFWIEPEDVLVRKDRIKEVVKELMGSGEAADERRKRAREFAEMAKTAVEEGGSSYNNLTVLIEGLKLHSRQLEVKK